MATLRAGGSAVLERNGPLDLDSVVIDPSARPMLTPEVRPLVSGAVDLLLREANRRAIPWERIVIKGNISWEEGDRTIRLILHLRLPEDEAEAYWETLEEPIQAWLSTLSDEQEETVYWRIGIRVQGIRENAAV